MKELIKKWWFWVIVLVLVILIRIGICNDENNMNTKITTNITNNTTNIQNISKNVNRINNSESNITVYNNISSNTNINIEENTKKNLITSNSYRFKNSIDEVKLYFDEIYTVSEWKGIKPHNDYFLIMKATAKSNTPSDNLYYFPYIVSDSNQKQYLSINDTFNYNYEDLEGNTVDIATEINLRYVKKEEGKISAYNTNFVKAGNGTRYLVFDISKETAEDSKIYLIFQGTERDEYKDEVTSKNVYFYDYIEKK